MDDQKDESRPQAGTDELTEEEKADLRDSVQEAIDFFRKKLAAEEEGDS
ncbi:MAG: hypothetical protein P1U86_01990 [Verrucomicrobiales bacterium]|nr:hypothetical protein [Verrucomicrobiales bacterium]